MRMIDFAALGAGIEIASTLGTGTTVTGTVPVPMSG